MCCNGGVLRPTDGLEGRLLGAGGGDGYGLCNGVTGEASCSTGAGSWFFRMVDGVEVNFFN